MTTLMATGLFTQGYPLLECLQKQFNVLLKRYAGGVAYEYEENRAFSLKQLCASWLFTLFCSSFPSKVGLRVRVDIIGHARTK